jgi:hypothetical protein
MNKSLKILRNPSDWDSFLSEDGARILLTQRRYESKVLPNHSWLLQRQADIAEKINFWDSNNTQKKKWVAWFLNNNIQEKDLSADYEPKKNEN